MSQSRTLRAELLAQLLEEGQATTAQLVVLSGYPNIAVVNTLFVLRESGACVRTKTKNALGYSESLFGLTRAGIEAALAAEKVGAQA